MNFSNILVIIPAYNEEKSIFRVVSSVKDEYPDLTVVVIDDGSDDNTAEIARQAGGTVLCHPFNMGYGVTIQTGYKYALSGNYKYLVQIDGDGQHETKDIETLLENLADGSCDIVLGSRFLGSISYKSTLYRHIGTLFFRNFLRLFSITKITDPTTGFQAMNRKVLKIFAQDSFPCDYPDADVIIMLSKLNIRIKEVPVRMYNNHNDKSMHSNPFNVLYYLFKIILSIGLTLLRKH